MLDTDEIKAILPHRSPMLLVDRVQELIHRKLCIGAKDVSESDWLVKGQGGRRFFPPTLVIEAMAQIGGIPMFTPATPTALIVSMDSIEIEGSVGAGETIRLQGEVLWNRGKLFKVAVEACTPAGFRAKGFITYAGFDLVETQSTNEQVPATRELAEPVTV